MKTSKTLISSLLALLSSIANASPAPKASKNLIVETTSGKITGFISHSYPDVTQFLSIPYAKCPTSDLRFAPPKRFASNNYFEATNTPYACPQFQPTSPPCKDEKLPVLVFLHGGGLQTRSSSIAYQPPPPWIQRTKSHIVVAVQYCLNIFGFPNSAGLNQSNLGLMDQRIGSEWVCDNIAALGGDLNKTVLWGQYYGAASTDAQNFAFLDGPIVNGFIQDSGSALVPFGEALVTEDLAHRNFTFVANALGCPMTAAEQLACSMPPLNFIGTPDEKIVFSNYTYRSLGLVVSTVETLVHMRSKRGMLCKISGCAKNTGNPEMFGWQEADSELMLMLGTPGGPAVKVINETIVDIPCKEAGL
ncbi:hypothetical protein G7Y89_g10245 [Cudoniella acicularis]|uniref:Carboxylesterase type B domain-containing protein n=1 Tax=Cudoniella acicularis TaxID=354080 RepID=A0A8H4RD50_9HELO|nr:hypothetical protein G7Y89_g10245 [Cudoniella acicularis]